MATRPRLERGAAIVSQTSGALDALSGIGAILPAPLQLSRSITWVTGPLQPAFLANNVGDSGCSGRLDRRGRTR